MDSLSLLHPQGPQSAAVGLQHVAETLYWSCSFTIPHCYTVEGCLIKDVCQWASRFSYSLNPYRIAPMAVMLQSVVGPLSLGCAPVTDQQFWILSTEKENNPVIWFHGRRDHF